MKSHKQLLLSILFAVLALTGLSAQEAGKDQADKMAKDAKEITDNIPDRDRAAKKAAEEVADAIKKAGKDHPNDADKVKKAVEDKLKEIRDRKSKKDAPGGDKKEVKELVKNLLKKLFGNEGETTAGKIKDELDAVGLDLDGNSEDDERQRIKDAADAAADKDPHDSKAVKDAVKKKIEEEIEKAKNNKTISDWLKTVREWLKGKNLVVSMVIPTDGLEWIAITGTGRTTGHVATLTLHNPGSGAVTASIPSCFIPSDGGYQPYITLPTTARVLPGETLQIAMLGYCADVHMPPLPKGHTVPAQSNLIRLDETPPNVTAPMVTPGAGTSGTSFPINNPAELGPVLFKALEQISQAYDGLSGSGSITTPFSGHPEKERESVIQQTFWIYTSALSGKAYNKEDFRSNLINQFETTSGQPFRKAAQPDKERVEAGVSQFWDTFQLVGSEAKVLSTHSK